MVNNNAISIPVSSNQKFMEQRVRGGNNNNNNMNGDSSFESATPMMKGVMIAMLIFLIIGSATFLICTIVFNIMALDGGFSIVLSPPNLTETGWNQTQYECEKQMGLFLLVQGCIWLSLLFFICFLSIRFENLSKKRERVQRISQIRKFIDVNMQFLLSFAMFVWTFYSFGELSKNEKPFIECSQEVYDYVKAIILGLLIADVLLIILLLTLCLMYYFVSAIMDDDQQRRQELIQAQEFLNEATRQEGDEDGVVTPVDRQQVSSLGSGEAEAAGGSQVQSHNSQIDLESTAHQMNTFPASSSAELFETALDNLTSRSDMSAIPQGSGTANNNNNQQISIVMSDIDTRGLPVTSREIAIWMCSRDQDGLPDFGPLTKQEVLEHLLEGKINAESILYTGDQGKETGMPIPTISEFAEYFVAPGVAPSHSNGASQGNVEVAIV